MSQTVELELGDLYANLHERFSEQIGEEYDQRARTEMEEFLHNFNQQYERQVEQIAAQQEEQEELDLSEEDIEDTADE